MLWLRQWHFVAIAATWSMALLIVAGLTAAWFGERTASASTTPSVASPAVDALAAAEIIAAQHLMGLTPSKREEEPPPVSYRLLGAMTATGNRPGFAILAEGSSPALAVIEGDAVAPGLRLIKVQPEHVLLSHDGRTERLALDWGNRLPVDAVLAAMPAEKPQQPAADQ